MESEIKNHRSPGLLSPFFSIKFIMINLKQITMPCKVGITTSPVQQTVEWKVKFPRFTNWRILGNDLSYPEAKRLVEFYASQFKCEAFVVQEKPNDQLSWYVYYFEV